MKARAMASTALGAALALAAAFGCTVEPQARGPGLGGEHCSEVQGDLTCRAAYGSRPYCSGCIGVDDHRGCTASMPAPSCRVGESSASTGGSAGEFPSPGTDAGGTSSGGTNDGLATHGSSSGASGGASECIDDAACEVLDPGRPYCVEGQCLGCDAAGGEPFCESVSDDAPLCTNSGRCAPCSETPEVCTDEGLVCSADSGRCVTCSSHADCPDSACHLAPNDPLVGRCFAPESVVHVDRDQICPGTGTADAPNCSLAQAVATTPRGGERVVLVDGAGAAHDEHIVVPDDVTVAILGATGSSAPRLTGVSGHDTLTVDGGTVYVHGVRIVDNENRSGVRCNTGTVWVQNSQLRGNRRHGFNAAGPCRVTLERTSVTSNAMGGVRAVGADVRLDNTAIGLNGTGSAGPGVLLFSANLEMLYSTLAGNAGAGADSLQCDAATGRVRNSIVVGASNASIELDCFSLTFRNSAIDTTNFVGTTNVLVPAYEPNWFVGPSQGDFRLAAPPLSPFGGVASWEVGDPPLDADGTPRPQTVPGYAGVDEP